MQTWGEKIKLTVFGSSHGPEVGVIAEGLPPGLELNSPTVTAMLERRRPGKALATARREPDLPLFSGGVVDGRTDGRPLRISFANRDVDDSAYLPGLCRPGHADYPAYCKYGANWDHRGGGQFSGRMTAPLVAVGALACDWLGQRGVTLQAHLVEVGGSRNIEERIRLAQAEGDSVGGLIEASVRGLPVGVGEPFFASCESVIASLMFSVPGVKALEFGDGVSLSAMRGSEALDPYAVDADGRISLTANHNGGLLGGLTTGADLRLRVAFKPTPSLTPGRRLLDLPNRTLVEPQTTGRHDPCIALRAVPVVEAVLAISLMELMI